MTSETITEDLVNDLAGHNFCQSEELALDQSQIEDCQSYIKDFLPIILTYAFNRNIRALHLSKYDAGTTLTFYPVVAVKVHVLNSYQLFFA